MLIWFNSRLPPASLLLSKEIKVPLPEHVFLKVSIVLIVLFLSLIKIHLSFSPKADSTAFSYPSFDLIKSDTVPFILLPLS